jgi:hypothetical protein
VDTKWFRKTRSLSENRVSKGPLEHGQRQRIRNIAIQGFWNSGIVRPAISNYGFEQLHNSQFLNSQFFCARPRDQNNRVSTESARRGVFGPPPSAWRVGIS